MGQVVNKSDQELEIVCEDGSRVIAKPGEPVDVPDADEERLLEREDFGKQAPRSAAKTKESN